MVVVGAPLIVEGVRGGWGSPMECDLGDVVGVSVRVSAFGMIA